ncbi:NAD(P)-dependent oxidoreductase [Neoroseomonas rubea]|uniref:NAD(P)-dependent oxidoreductase n=1 Tax=Neoroseomonas rubea TaxID=2748666 RepID=UPI0018DF1DA3|nr:NAD(P)-dependent oxidoreductase [Roseomonas rubea]
MVAVIGLGNMGFAMLRRLIAAGRTPRAWDLEEERRAAAAAAGAAVPGGLGGAVGPEVILSLPDAGAVGTVLSAVLPVLSKGSVILDTSTLAPAEARGFAATAESWGCAYLDAPVSGGPAGAAAGTLAMMIGGDGAALARARPVIDLLAARVLHIGPSGAGQVAKLVNNLLVATNLVVSAEALRLGAAAGVAPEALLPVINGATGRSAATEVNWPRWILPGTFDSGFSAGLMRKDVRLALGLAQSVDAPLDATARAAAAWEALADAAPDEADFNRLAAAILGGGTA